MECRERNRMSPLASRALIVHSRDMDYAGAYSVIVGKSARAVRLRRDLGQEQVAARMRALGFTGWLRQTVGQVERGKRRLVVDEALALSFALETTLAELIMPAADEDYLELPNGHTVSVAIIRHSIRGTRATGLRWNGDVPVFPAAGQPFTSALEQDRGRDQADLQTELLQRVVDLERRLEQAITPYQTEDPVQPVVAAIVTSPLGVLVGRRNDGKPPWTFIAGEQEPGEREEDTAIREVKEETGLRIEAGDVIGERVHPKTGRRMVYMAAAPTHGTDVIVGDEEELAEVKWATLAEVEQLMQPYGMFDPVHDHLRREIGGGTQ